MANRGQWRNNLKPKNNNKGKKNKKKNTPSAKPTQNKHANERRDGAARARENTVNKVRQGATAYTIKDATGTVLTAAKGLTKGLAQAPTRAASGAIKNSQNRAGYGNRGKSGSVASTGGNTTGAIKRAELTKAQSDKIKKQQAENKKNNDKNGYAWGNDAAKTLDKASKSIGKAYDKTVGNNIDKAVKALDKSKKKDLKFAAEDFSGEKKYTAPIYSKYVKGKAEDEYRKTLEEQGYSWKKSGRKDANKALDNLEKEYGLTNDTVLKDGTTWEEYRKNLLKEQKRAYNKAISDEISDKTKNVGKFSAKDIVKGGIKTGSEFVQYAIPYGGTTAKSLELAEKAIAKSATKTAVKGGTKAISKQIGKEVSEAAVKKAIAKRGGKLTDAQITKLTKKLNAKAKMKGLAYNTKKELLANAMQDATVGTALDYTMAKKEGYKGDELLDYMTQSAIGNVALGVPMTAIAGRSGAKAVKAGIAEGAAEDASKIFKMTPDEGAELIALNTKANSVKLNDAEIERQAELQTKAMGTGGVEVNAKGNIVRRKEGDISTVMSQPEIKEYINLKTKDAVGVRLSPENKGKLKELQNKAENAYKITETNSENAIKMSPKDADIGNVREAASFFERTGQKQKLAKANALLEKTINENENALKKITDASTQISKDIKRSVVIEDELSIAKSLEATGRSVDDYRKLGGFAELDDNGNIVAIHINKDSEHALQFTLGHELTHAFESLGESYNSFKQSIREFVGEDAWNDELNYVASQYNDIVDAKYENETLANFVGDMLFDADGEFLRKLAGTKPTLFERIRDFIKKIIGDSDGAKLKEINSKFDDLYSELVAKNADSEAEEATKVEFLYGGERSLEDGKHPQLEKSLQSAKSYMATAEKMYAGNLEALDKERLKIFRDTRWFKGWDGKWRYEIDDSRLSFANGKKPFMRPPEGKNKKSVVYTENGEVKINEELYDKYLERVKELNRKKKLTKSEQGELKKCQSQLAAAEMYTGDGAPIGYVLKHDALFEMYPDAENIRLHLKNDKEYKDIPQKDFDKYKKYKDEVNELKAKINAGTASEQDVLNYNDLVARESEYKYKKGFDAGGLDGDGNMVLNANILIEGSNLNEYIKLLGKDPEKLFKQTIVHELQHDIQRFENFARGSSEGNFIGDIATDALQNIYPKNVEKYGARLNKLQEERENILFDMDFVEMAGNEQQDAGQKFEEAVFALKNELRAQNKLESKYKLERKVYASYMRSLLDSKGELPPELKTLAGRYFQYDYEMGRIAERNPKRLYQRSAGETEAREVSDRLYDVDAETGKLGNVKSTKDRNKLVPHSIQEDGKVRNLSFASSDAGDDTLSGVNSKFPDRTTKPPKKPSETTELLYGGRGALKANQESLLEAIDLLEKGKEIMRNGGKGYKSFQEWEALNKERVYAGLSRDEIRKKTGWFQGVDGKWRFEISDFGMHGKMGIKNMVRTSVDAEKQGETLTMKDFIEHEKLYENYPDAKDIPLSFINDKTVDWSGCCGEDGIKLNVAKMFVDGMTKADKNSELKRVLSHELQHFIQRKEGFAKGGNPQRFAYTQPWKNQEEYIQRIARIKKAQTAARDALMNENFSIREYVIYYSTHLKDAVNEAVKQSSDAHEFEKLLDKVVERECANVSKTTREKIFDWVYEVRSMDFENIPKVSNGFEAYEFYHDVVGENEARDVMNRQKLPDKTYERDYGAFVDKNDGRNDIKPSDIRYAEKLERLEAEALDDVSKVDEANKFRNRPRWSENARAYDVSEDSLRLNSNNTAGELFPDRLTNPLVELSYGNKRKATSKSKVIDGTETKEEAGLTGEQTVTKRRLDKATSLVEKQEKRVEKLEKQIENTKDESKKAELEKQLAEAKKGRRIARANRTRLKNKLASMPKTETELPKGEKAPKKPSTKVEKIKEGNRSVEQIAEDAKNGYISAHEMGQHAKRLGETWSSEVESTEKAFREAAKSGEFGGKLKRTESYKTAYEKATKAVEEDFGKVYDRVMQRQDFDVENTTTAAEKNAVLVELIKRAGQGDENAALMHLKVVDKMDKVASLSGHMLQLQSYILRNSPEGRLRFTMREVEKINKEYAKALKGKEIKLTSEQIQRIIDAKDPLEIAKTMDDISKEVWKQVPAGLLETLNQIRHFAMLFNPKTHGRNVAGNSVFAGARLMSDGIETFLSKKTAGHLKKLSGLEKYEKKLVEINDALKKDGLTEEEIANLKKARASMKREIRLAKEDIKNPMNHSVTRSELKNCDKVLGERYKVDYIKNEQTSSRWAEGKRTAGYVNERTKSKVFNWIANKANKGIDTNYNFLDKEDKWFFEPAYKKEYIRYCKSKGFTEKINGKDVVTPKSLNAMNDAQKEAATSWAMQEAKVATFRDDSAIAKRLIAWKNATETKAGTGKPMYRALNVAMESVLPFVKTPVNVMRRGMDYSPIGLIRGLTESAFAKNPHEFMDGIHHLSTGLTGTGVFAIGIWAASHDWVTVEAGDVSGDAFYDRDMGYQDYSLKICGHSWTLDWAAPSQFAFFQGAAAYQTLRDNGFDSVEDILTGIEKLSGATVSPLMNMSFMSSAKDTVASFAERAYRDGTGGEATILQSAARTLFGTLPTDWLSGFVPQLVNQAAGFSDDKMRDTSSTKENEIAKVWDSFGKQMKNRIPVFRQSLNPKINRKGEEVEATAGPNILTKLALSFINPANVKKITMDKYDEAIIDTYSNMKDEDAKTKMMLNLTGNPFYDVKGEWLGKGKKDTRMTYDQRSEYLATNRKLQWDSIKRMVDSKVYNEMSVDMRAEEIKDYHYISTTKADAKVFGYKYAKNKLTDKSIDSSGAQKEIWDRMKMYGGSAKDFVDSYVAIEDLAARAHATGSDYHTKALAIESMKFKGSKADANKKRDMLGKSYDIYGDKLEPAKKFLKQVGNTNKALTEYAEAHCAGVAVCNVAKVSSSKKNLSLGLANAKTKVKERTYRAMGYDWQSAQAGGGLKKYGYTYKALDKMEAEAKKKFDTDHNNSLKKAEVMAYIESLGIKNTDEMACIFEHMKSSGNTKNPYGIIKDHLEWGSEPDASAGGGSYGHGHGRRYGHGHGGSGGGSGGTPPTTASGAIGNPSVTNPFSKTTNGSKKSNLDDAYRKKAKKLRQNARG